MSFIGKPTEFLDLGAVKINPFPKLVPCTTNQTFCQPTNQFDDIAFQFLVSESTELVLNGDFQTDPFVEWTIIGWSRVLNLLNFTMTQTTGVNALSQKGILTVNDFYRVRITVSNYSGGILTVGGGTGSAITNTALSILSNGTFEGFFQYTEVAGAGDFIIQGVGAITIGIRVDDVSVIKIADTSDYDIQIINQETGALIDTVPSANVRLSENIITVDYNWTDDVTVTNGCRQIQIIDNTNIFEDTFANNQGWTLDTDIVISGGLMTYTSTGVSRKATIPNIFVVGETYQITFTTSGVTGTGTVQVICGRTLGTIRSTNATFVETLTCTLTNILEFSFNGAAASTVSIDNVLISKENNIAGRSECYDLQTDHDCTLLFKWSNDESWGGFDYSIPSVGTAFNQQLRIEAKFRGTQYPSTRIIGEDSAGRKTVDYTLLRKVKILDIHRAPDYMHDAVAAFFAQDNRTIEDISYIMEDEYEPSSPNESRVLFKDLMTSRSELEVSTQPNQINRNV
ncbi:hypothetical protein LCGC14_0388500 [marine sediment metagenome]|uniref:Uncharacterized protein n=1 Tax=marine sediment metagenome TaxID=412755 RepID=A0A0F9W993_9ZZZZ